jgi:beta-1,4-mannosyl-glycoprotein beta-1,4-N-acetylglucosaminyltransferase
MAKIYDVITFFNELDLLELRLEMLDPYVDRFVIVECVETFSGKPKPLHLKENYDRYKKYHHKITHHVNYFPLSSYEDAQTRVFISTNPIQKQICIQALTSNNVPKGELHWLKEFHQKEMIRYALTKTDIQPDDLCFISDLDEIWNPELDYKNIDHYKIYKLKQLSYSLYLNNRSNEPWAGTLLTRYKNIHNSCLNHLRTPSKTQYEFIDNGGWHFTFMGGKEQIKKKIEAYGHQEYNNDGVKQNIENNLKDNRDVLGRTHLNFWIDETDLPEYIKQNKTKYKNYFKWNN